MGLALALALALGGSLRALVPPDLHPVSDPAAALLGVCLGLVPVCLDGRPTEPFGIALAAATAGVLVLLLGILPGGRPVGAEALAGAALGAGALTWLIGALAALLAPLCGSGSAALGWVLAGTLVLAASPLWLAAPLERGLPVASLSVAVNPLTVLAMPSGADYPRSDWLYRHSPLGSLRYRYPPAALPVAICLAAGLGAVTASGRRRRSGRAAIDPALPPSPHDART